MKTDARNAPRADRYVEEGAAFADIAGIETRSTPRTRRPRTSHGNSSGSRHDVIVIGAGQAGLSVGHHLRRRGLSFLILDANERVGDSWRKRWDSLRLFTSAGFDGLPGMPFPAHRHHFPTKDEMADYLESYAERFELPIQTGTEVTRLSRRDGRFVVETSAGSLEADQVVVAMADYQKPRVPVFAEVLREDVVQIHSSEYRRPSQLREGGVLVVGAGNSGAEIAMELSTRHRVWLSGRDVGHLPFHIAGPLGRLLLVRLVLRVLFHRVLTIRTPMGRKMRPRALSRGVPLIRVKPQELEERGVERVPRTTGTVDGLPKLEDGRVLDVSNVIWCTGFDRGFPWIDLPIFDDDGNPRHDGGVAEDQPGLYFVGMQFLYSMSSSMVHGVGRDAERIAETVARRARATKGAARPQARTA